MGMPRAESRTKSSACLPKFNLKKLCSTTSLHDPLKPCDVLHAATSWSVSEKCCSQVCVLELRTHQSTMCVRVCIRMGTRESVQYKKKKSSLHQFSSFLWFLRLHATVLCWSMHAGVCRQQDACIASAWEGILWWTASTEWQIVSRRCHKSRPLPLSATFKHSQEATGCSSGREGQRKLWYNKATHQHPQSFGRHARPASTKVKEHQDKWDPVVTPACLLLTP